MTKAGKKHAPPMVYASRRNLFLFTNHLKLAWPWWRLAFTVLASLALVLSTILSWHSLKGGQMAGCGGESPCGQVLNSRWSLIAGVLPVSGLAVGAYLAILVAGFFISPDTEVSIRRLAWKAILILAGSVAGSAVWFTIIQKWVIGEFCPYCMATHITGLLLASLVIWRVYTEFDKHPEDFREKNGENDGNGSLSMSRRIIRPLPATGLVLAGLALAGTLAAIQTGFTPLPVYSDSTSHYNMPPIDYNAAPMVGLPDAPYIVTVLFDYQCSHCQKIHFMLDEAVRRYAGKLAFVLCPAPLNSRCNPYIPQEVDAFGNSCELVRIGLAVWLASRNVFPDFENWMFTFETGNYWLPRSPEAAKAKAVEMVGLVKLDEALANPWIEQYLHTCTQIYGQTIMSGKGGVPKMLYGSRWVIPEPYSTDDLIMLLQNSLGVPEP